MTRAAPTAPLTARPKFVNPARLGLPEISASAQPRAVHSESRMKDVLVAACSSREVAWDLEQARPQGAMTHYALRAMRAADYRLSYDDLEQRLRALISDSPNRQTPRIEGNGTNTSRQLFS
jgi:hypothetical protein